MKNFNITSCESLTSKKGMAYKKVTLKDESGAEHANVAIFSSFPDFANINEGSTVTGELKIEQNGQYVNKSLTYPNPTTGGANRGQSGGFIAKAMEKKEAGIEKAQENKNESIKIASTFGKAVDCAIAEYNKDATNLDTLEELIRKWRKILWFEFDNHNEYPPFIK